MVYVLAKAYRTLDYKDNFGPERKNHKKRYGAKRTPMFVAQVVKENPGKCMRKVAKEINISSQTIERIIKDDNDLKMQNFRLTIPLVARLMAPYIVRLDYFEWHVLEWELNSRPYNTIEALKTGINEAISIMGRDAINMAYSSFLSYLETVVATSNYFCTLYRNLPVYKFS